MTVKLLIAGAAGRMGNRIAALAAQDPGLQVIYGLESAGRSVAAAFPIGTDTSFIEKADVVIDFTIPEATVQLLPMMRKYKKAFVVGTTGFKPEQESQITALSREIPIVKSSNMSLGVNVFFSVAQRIAQSLPEYAVHIQETHHVHKKDAPSGTALQAGGLIEKATGKKVTYESIREGEVIGDHRIFFRGPADHLELAHHAESRDILAAGALKAAQWVVRQKPGLYSMQDVFGL
ncbi:MAG: 4-hydroxy-tetrahydrodipicolinate reductase [Elusimicrobiota bacterium]